ncbi:MAG TPA: protein kinase [Planctomycetota bacterium]|nr:protein kinase [Planctomycetota bacterium]
MSEPSRETVEPGSYHATTIIGADSRPLADSNSGVKPSHETRVSTPALIGPFRVVSELGRGGMGVVYKALDAQEKPVAIKMILDPRRAGDENLRRFEREARAAMRLRHPNIVQVQATGMHEGKPYLVMELVDGDSLETLLQRGPMPTRQVIEIVRAIAIALDHAHAQGVVHRDLKPENILVDKDGVPHLADFGLARDVTENENLTTTGTVLGTPAYMAPEQAGGETHEQGPHSDIYGLGAVLYRALAGQPPFKASTVSAMMKKVLFDAAPAPSRFNPAVPLELDQIVLRCLTKNPALRYPSGAALAEELRRFVAGEPMPIRPVLGFGRRHPRIAALLVLALLGGAGTAGWWFLVERPARIRAAAEAEEARRRSKAQEDVTKAVALAKESQFIGALDALDEAIALVPDMGKAWHERGQVKLKIFDLDGALADLGKSLELDSRDPDTWNDKAELHFERHEWDAAISAASRAIALAPKGPRGYMERGRARHAKGDRDRGIDDLRDCCKLFGEDSHDDPIYRIAEGHLRAMMFGR